MASIGDMDGGKECYEGVSDGEGESEDDGESSGDTSDGSSVEGGSDGREERDIIEVDETRKEEKWDCESILRCLACDCHVTLAFIVVVVVYSSTYSTLYNHPTRIVEPRTRTKRDSGGDTEIKLSRKTGMPLGVISGPLPKEHHPSRGDTGWDIVIYCTLIVAFCSGTITRPKNEGKEEKRARKSALKEDRKVCILYPARLLCCWLWSLCCVVIPSLSV